MTELGIKINELIARRDAASNTEEANKIQEEIDSLMFLLPIEKVEDHSCFDRLMARIG